MFAEVLTEADYPRAGIAICSQSIYMLNLTASQSQLTYKWRPLSDKWVAGNAILIGNHGIPEKLINSARKIMALTEGLLSI